VPTGWSCTPSPTPRLGHRRSKPRSWKRYAAAAQAALDAGLGVNAGHDLNRDNLTDFLREPCPVCSKCPSATR
jgi:pyridoxine 5'-phosphate synthase PdxJ